MQLCGRLFVLNCTTPKLITDYDTSLMIHNELGGEAFVNCKLFT